MDFGRFEYTLSFTRAREGRYKYTSWRIESFFFINLRRGGGIPFFMPQISAPFQALDILETRLGQNLDGGQGQSASGAHGHYLLLLE